MLCYISRKFHDTSTAGRKAKTDTEAILRSLGAVNIGCDDNRRNNKAAEFFAILGGILRAVSRLHRGDVLILQYPLKKYYTFICKAAHLRGARVVTLIHDLGSFRRRRLTPQKEVRRLSNSDFIIALNPAMQQWLTDNSCHVPSTPLLIWDFLSPSEPPQRSLTTPMEIVYAGALGARKNRFIYDWAPYIRDFSVNLYGWGYDAEAAGNPEAIRPQGFMDSDTLIASARGQFGLVWDGDSIDTCAGHWGEYLRYNNPHKTSLYIRCGLPLIVWSQAAMAPFVLSEGIGIAVDSLCDLPAALSAVTPESYSTMLANVDRVRARISRGTYLTEALRTAIATLESTTSF